LLVHAVGRAAVGRLLLHAVVNRNPPRKSTEAIP
jgi:hypothetical protein